MNETAIETSEISETAEFEPPAPAPPVIANLFGTDDPELVIAEIVRRAGALANVIREKKLYARIRGEEYVTVEGWTLLGTMLGVFPWLEWTRPLPEGWEARVEARTLDGRVVSSGESECLRSESKWKERDDFQIRSMAATRATSRALRQPLGFVMKLAGYSPTPAEEVDSALDGTTTRTERARSRAAPVAVTVEQLEQIQTHLRALRRIEPERDWSVFCREQAGPLRELSQGGAAILIRLLEEQLAARVGSEEAGS
jgi:hypothetical protein